MKFIVRAFCGALIAFSTAVAQVELVSGNYFPAELEFQELQKITLEESFVNPEHLSKVEDGRLFSDVGFEKYAKRVYSTGDSAAMSIEVVTLLDSRAAYSTLTLLRKSNLQDGPPGDFFVKSSHGLQFSQGRLWVRIQGDGASEDLVRRLAISVSNRIGPQQSKAPALVAHMPKSDYDSSTLRYYPGTKAFEDYSGIVGGTTLRVNSDMEIAQARYSKDNLTGTLSLLSFPTAEVAEEYFSELTVQEPSPKAGNKTYLKRAGPIVAILEGSFDPGTADKILSPIQFSYSIRWVYEKNQPKMIWGIPGSILSTVVKSLFFVLILGGLSIIVGIGIALFRFRLRRRSVSSPDHPDKNEMTRLKMR
jgi:hypothetical protein